MNKVLTVQPKFVERIPEHFNAGVIYVSIQYGTVVHKCCCGCGEEVVTPLSPTDWRIIYDGEAISLMPSIGNWSLKCQSHYWVVQNRIVWALKWSAEQIQKGRDLDRDHKQGYYAGTRGRGTLHFPWFDPVDGDDGGDQT